MALGRIDPDLSFAPPHTVRTPSAMERSVVRNLERSISVPVFHLSSRVSLHPLAERAKSSGFSLTLALVKACALAILDHPRFNSLWTRQGVLLRERVDIGVAVDTGEGLVAPVLRDVAGRPLAEISEDWRTLKEKASLGRLVPADYLGGTFYISNLGTYPGVASFDAVLPPTASAIMAVSAPADVDQKSVLTLTCDHRILYGAHAARFSATLSRRLEEPSDWISGPT
jgi:pyruvate dehydrogenase E2 component (dihydrolipoamide acetyltransferase)